MNKIIAAIVALAVIGTPALAVTNIWTNVGNTGGYTSYQQETWVGGYDWSEGSDQMTGYIVEGFTNDGSIGMNKEIHNDGQWILEEKLEMGGCGDTEIFKNVNVWTEDTTLYQNAQDPWRWRIGPDGGAKDEPGQNGELAYPSELWVEYSFIGFDTPMTDADTFYAIVKEPPAQNGQEEGNHAYYNKYITTNDEFNFGEKVGIGDFPSDFVSRPTPEFPEMCWFEWR